MNYYSIVNELITVKAEFIERHKIEPDLIIMNGELFYDLTFGFKNSLCQLDIVSVDADFKVLGMAIETSRMLGIYEVVLTTEKEFYKFIELQCLNNKS